MEMPDWFPWALVFAILFHRETSAVALILIFITLQ